MFISWVLTVGRVSFGSHSRPRVGVYEVKTKVITKPKGRKVDVYEENLKFKGLPALVQT